MGKAICYFKETSENEILNTMELLQWKPWIKLVIEFKVIAEDMVTYSHVFQRYPQAIFYILKISQMLRILEGEKPSVHEIENEEFSKFPIQNSAAYS